MENKRIESITEHIEKLQVKRDRLKRKLNILNANISGYEKALQQLKREVKDG